MNHWLALMCLVRPSASLALRVNTTSLAITLVLVAFVAMPSSFAGPLYFESFSTTWLPSDAVANTLAGTVDLQDGWTTRDSFTTTNTIRRWDQQVVQLNDANGNRKVFRMSNAITNNTYPSQVFSATVGEVAGESNAALWNNRGTNGSAPVNPPGYGAYAANDSFYSMVAFRSATGAAQGGLSLALSASAKQSSVRMSYLQLQDSGNGFNLNFIEAGANGSSFPQTTIASGLSYTDLHKIEMLIDFVDGVSTVDGAIYGNDVVKIWLNDSLIHAGTTWETYYYNNERITTGVPRLQAVDSMLFRVAGSAAAGTSGKGFYFEDFAIGNVYPVPEPSTYAMALAGLACGGFSMWRRRKQA